MLGIGLGLLVWVPAGTASHTLAETVARRLRLDQVGRAVEPGGADTEGDEMTDRWNWAVPRETQGTLSWTMNTG